MAPQPMIPMRTIPGPAALPARAPAPEVATLARVAGMIVWLPPWSGSSSPAACRHGASAACHAAAGMLGRLFGAASLDCAHAKNVLRGKPIECQASNEPVVGLSEKRRSEQSLNAAPEDGLLHGQKLRNKAERAAEPSPAMADPLLWFEVAGTQKPQPRAAVEPAVTATVNSSIGGLR